MQQLLITLNDANKLQALSNILKEIPYIDFEVIEEDDYMAEHIAIAEERIEEYKKNPSSGIPFEEVMKRLKDK